MKRYKKGTVVAYKKDVTILKRIIQFIERGYLWEYADLPSSERNTFFSGNSVDPYLNVYHKIVKQNEIAI